MADSKRILIVDDDPVIRQLMASSLTSQGCEVSVASAGAAALTRALAQPPDLILLDVLLPDLNGIELCRRVRAEPLLAEVPVIMITALNDAEARLGSLEAGADDFITKPVDFLELRARVGSILRLNRYRRLLDERTQRQRAEEETLRRNRELLLLNAFLLSTVAGLRAASQFEEALRDACRLLVEALEVVAAARAELRLAGHADVLRVSVDAAGGSEDASALLVPLLINGAAGGAITVHPVAGRSCAAQERAFVQVLAGALGQAIERVMLHQQLAAHAESLAEVVARRTGELKAERDRTQAILDALGEAVIVTDAAWRISYANPATAALTGHAPAELRGRLWSELGVGASAAALYQLICDQAAAGQTWRGEVSGVRRDGSPYDAAMTVAPLFDPQLGPGPGLVSIQRDITPLKEAERLKDRFIANVSHELRTPLSVIALHSGNLDTLYERLGDGQRRRLIREVRAQAELLDDLIGDVLELSRIDSGRSRAEQRPLDLAALLAHEAELLRPLAERSGLTLEVRAPEPLPVVGDEAQLSQCVRNLLSNAIKFTPAGGAVVCECRLLPPGPVNQGEWPAYLDIDTGSWAGLRVVDSGVGIAAEHLPHLFERFYRVKTQGRVPGTGLGLAITRELVTRHGGWAGVASTPGAGSTFALYLPIAEA